jgi:hypothetical protein
MVRYVIEISARLFGTKQEEFAVYIELKIGALSSLRVAHETKGGNQFSRGVNTPFLNLRVEKD